MTTATTPTATAGTSRACFLCPADDGSEITITRPCGITAHTRCLDAAPPATYDHNIDTYAPGGSDPYASESPDAYYDAASVRWVFSGYELTGWDVAQMTPAERAELLEEDGSEGGELTEAERALLAPAATVDTGDYTHDHAGEPYGDGLWLFVPAGDGDAVPTELTGPYAVVVYDLPAGAWKVLP